ncbi:MAG: hypothetical protein HYV97_13670 [Bdellovibrio sp.]|nr:hypothetical protein [Bdellovibrio sp.]
MKTELKSLDKKICRMALDTVFFTASKKIRDDKDLTDISESTMQYYANELDNILFSGIGKPEKVRRRYEVGELTTIGIFASVYMAGNELKLTVQFKGVFFADDDAFKSMQDIALGLIKKFDIPFRVTRIDVCQDIMLNPFEILPASNMQTIQDGYIYHFKHTYAEYHKCDNASMIYTGFGIKTSRFELVVYDKKEELQHCRSQRKKEYYDKYLEAIGGETPLTRCELRLKQENCEPFLEIIFDKSISEISFCKLVLKTFAKRHNLRTRSNGSVTKKYDRWPIHKNWLRLFYIEEPAPFELIKLRERRLTAPEKTAKQIMDMIADLCAHREIAPNLFLETLATFQMAPLMQKANKKRADYEKTQRVLEGIRSRVTSPHNNGIAENLDMLDGYLSGSSVGGSITSPTDPMDLGV